MQVYHLIIIPKYNGKAINVGESPEHEFSDDESAIKFFEAYISDMPLAFDTNRIFDITIFQGSREIKNFKLDKPLDIAPSSEAEMAYA